MSRLLLCLACSCTYNWSMNTRTRNEILRKQRQWGGSFSKPHSTLPSKTTSHCNARVRPSTTQSHPQPPHSAAQAEMPTPQSIPADNPDTGREQLLWDGNVRLETSMPVVQHRPARAALQEEDDVTHERPSSSFHIQHPSPQMTDSSTRGQSDFGAVKVTSKKRGVFGHLPRLPRTLLEVMGCGPDDPAT